MGDVLRSGLTDAWSALATFVPKLLGFLVILFVGWLIAKALSKGVQMILGRLGFARLVERAGLGEMAAKSKVDVGAIIVKLVYYFVLLIALQFAFSAFGPNPVGDLLAQIVTFLPRIVVALVLVLIASAIGRVVRDLVVAALGQRPYTRMLGTGVFAFIVALGVIAALNQVGIATTVTTPVLIAVLATVGGVLVIGVGGGMVRPMQQRWERWLDVAEAETGRRVPDARTPADAHATAARHEATTSQF